MRLFFAAMAFPLSLCALYNGCPILPQMPEENLFLGENTAFSLKATYQGDYVLNRRLKTFSSSHFHSKLNAAEISFGFIDRVEAYTLLGAFKSTFSGDKDNQSFRLQTTESFGGALGIRAIGLFWRETKIGFDAKYFYGWPGLASLRREGKSLSTKYTTSFDRDWQIGAALSQTFAFFTPYVGVKYAEFILSFVGSDFPGDFVIENINPFGVFVGFGLAGKKGPFFDFEAQFLDEYAFSGSLGLRF